MDYVHIYFEDDYLGTANTVDDVKTAIHEGIRLKYNANSQEWFSNQIDQIGALWSDMDGQFEDYMEDDIPRTSTYKDITLALHDEDDLESFCKIDFDKISVESIEFNL